MRPLRSFLLLLIFLACFTGLHYFIPVSRFFPPVYDFIPENLINNLLPDNDSSLSEATVNIPSNPGIHSDSAIYNVSKVISGPMEYFMDSLNNSEGQIRVMYYGDSQIEGDRITSYLRQTLRKGRSGTGPGLLLPLMPVMYSKTVWMRSSSNWKKYNYLSYKTGEISHRELGPFMAVCRYIPEGETTNEPEKATVRIRPSNLADSASSVYDKLRIFYGNNPGTVILSVKTDGNEVFTDTLRRGKGVFEINCSLKSTTDVLIEFTGKVSPDVYGISIESPKGLILDNIPQRGSAGLEFTMVDRDNLSASYLKLSPDLIILHYGLNIVRNVREDYSYYRKGLSRQISLLKEILPDCRILVISLTDMAFRDGDTIKPYRNIPSIIEAQRIASKESGAAFWDSYNAMGGSSSIIKWVEKKPALAQKDYVHFTYQGADTLSKILARALFSDKVTDTNRLKYSYLRSDTAVAVSDIPSSPPSLKVATQKVSAVKMIIKDVFRYDPSKPMIFSTALFWLFFLLVLAGYSFIYKKLFIRNFYLFLLSLFFYYKSGGLFLSLLIFVTLIDYTCGLLLHRSETKVVRRLIVLFSILSNLGILAYFKYTGFFVKTINDLFGTDYQVYDLLAAFSNMHLGTSFNLSEIVLPVGISFFTFQSLSYTFDVYRRKIKPVRNIIDFGFYVSFFPQLVAGPIVRASEG